MSTTPAGVAPFEGRMLTHLFQCSGFSFGDYGYYGSNALKLVSLVFAAVDVFVILPLVIRSLRLWWKGALYTALPANQDTPTISHIYPQAHGYPQYYSMPSRGPSNVRPSYQADDLKSNSSSRPLSMAETTAQWSTISGSQTLAYPNIMSATQARPSSVAPSTAPPYQRVEVGSKVH